MKLDRKSVRTLLQTGKVYVQKEVNKAKLSDDDKKSALELYSSGLMISDVARKLNISK